MCVYWNWHTYEANANRRYTFINNIRAQSCSECKQQRQKQQPFKAMLVGTREKSLA